MIAFSPKMWPVEQHPITKEHRKRLAVLQNGCELTNDDYSACYDSAAFDYKTAKSNTKKFELQRQSPNDYQACAMEKKQGQYYANAATFPTDNPPPDSCKWSVTYSSMRFMQPVSLTDSQLVADVAANLASGGALCSKHSDGTTWMYDYAFEICHHPGLCTENSWDCVAAYTIVALGDPFKGDSRNLFRYEAEVKDSDGKVDKQDVEVMPRQNPMSASGPLPSVYATPSEGPHFPCAVGANGKQLPCDDGKAASLAHTPKPDNLTMHITNFKLVEVPELTFGGYSLKFTYTATWNDRYAVHPCTINLYDNGKGVGANGKTVKSSEWWSPNPNTLGAMSQSVSHSSGLQVMHDPENAVTTACTSATCPWPKQLYLKDDITMEATLASGWDLMRHPFDTQTMSGTVNLVSNIAFAADVPYVAINFTDLAFDVGTIGLSTNDWTLLEAKVKQTGPLTVEFTIKIQRASASVFFKVMIPYIAVVLLSILAATMDAYERLMIVSFSVLVGATMLDPDFLGLPAGVEGVPFLMACVIGHMAINGLLLIYSLYISKGNFTEFWKLKLHEGRVQEAVFNVYDRAFAKYRKLASDPNIIGGCEAEISASKEQAANTVAARIGGSMKSLFGKKSKVAEGGDDAKEEEEYKVGEDTSEAGQMKKLTELMWLMPIMVGAAVHGNADNPPAMPMAKTKAYDLDSADAQSDKDELGQRVVARIIGPTYVFVFVVIVIIYFA